MANLDLIKRLNEQYGKKSSIRSETKLFAFNESIDPDRIEKALPDSLANMGPLFTAYFDLGLPADVTLLFVDVCSFSTRFSHLDGEEIAAFFDRYYDIVIPLIYKYGGEIDKIIGDGVICIFGPPFLNSDITENIKKANDCAKEIIKATEGGDFSSKVAIHCGTINYFKNKTGFYKEFTMIGKPLTEIFRLESVSIDERVNYYGDTDIKSYYERIFSRNSSASSSTGKFEWTHFEHTLPPLKGVDYSTYHSIKHNR